MIAGEGPAPSLVLSLIERLPDTSMTVALASGGKEHFGWSQDRYILADIFDALNQNTRATGNWGKGKPPKFPTYPRPTARRSGEKQKVTVVDLYNKFARKR